MWESTGAEPWANARGEMVMEKLKSFMFLIDLRSGGIINTIRFEDNPRIFDVYYTPIFCR